MALQKCDLNGKEVYKEIKNLIQSSLTANEELYPNQPDIASLKTMDEVYALIPSKLEAFKQKYKLATKEAVDELMNLVMRPITKYHYHELHPHLNLEEMYRIYEALGTHVQTTRLYDTSTDRLKDTAQTESILESSRAFLQDAYGNASEVRDAFLLLTNLHLFDLLFINRGFVPVDIEQGAVSDGVELNRNIRRYLEYLFQTILDYLRNVANTKSKTKVNGRTSALTNPNKAAILDIVGETKEDAPSLYFIDATGLMIVSPNIFSEIQTWLNLYLNPTNFTSDKLSLLFRDSRNRNSATRTQSKMKLDAYNAYILLKHFDDYMVLMLGKSININDFNRYTTNEEKYSLSEATANLASTWRASEDINVAEEVDNITKLAINTTPIYDWLQHTRVEGAYLTFNDYLHLIAKIKDLVYNPNTYRITFDARNSVIDRLPDYLLEFVTELSRLNPKATPVTLSDLINNIRENPRFYLHNVINLLANLDFYELYKSELYDGRFTPDELRKLWTLSKAIFSEPTERTNNSLYLLSNARAKSDFYAYLTLTADSIFSINYLQYYRDEDGQLLIRTLVDMGVDNIRRNLEDKINIQGGSELIKNYNDVINKYNIIPNFEEEQLVGCSFIIPDTEVKVSVDLRTSKVSLTGIDLSNPDNYHNAQLEQFIEDQLHLGLLRNAELYNLAVLAEGNEYNLLQHSLEAASHVIMNQYVNMTLIKPLEHLGLVKTTLDSLYGKEQPRYNYERGDISLVSAKDWQFLNKMASALANLTGMTTSSIVKDSNLKSLSMLSLSRLLGSFHSLWGLSEESENSATKGCLIMRPGFVEAVYTTKEFYDRIRGSKESTKISTSEMAYMGFVEDFIGGLYGPRGKVHGDGHTMFLPSVNSDKNTIGRLLVNLNLKVEVKDPTGLMVSKSLRELSSSELDLVIRKECYRVYGNILKRIKSDLTSVEALLEAAFPGYSATVLTGYNDGKNRKPLLSTGYTDNFQGFNDWFDANVETILSKFPTAKTPADLVKVLVKDYNLSHRFAPIELVDLMHITENKKGLLQNNKSLLALLYRAYPQGAARQYGIEAQLFGGRDYNFFWGSKCRELVTDLLKNKFKVNVNDDTKEDLKLIKNNPDLAGGLWILSNGNMALAYITYNGKGAYIGSLEDILRAFPEEFSSKTPTPENIAEIVNKSQMIINPLLEKWTKLDYLITLEWMWTTVGTFAAHPSKAGADATEIEEEASRFNALHKRNVSYTAAMHAFQLNTLHGIPDTYNIATIRDIEDFKGVVGGTTHKIKPFDGATFVNPFIVVLENESLEGAKAGITKKQFVHFKNERIGTGGIIKTAGFGLTNDWMRNSDFLQKMMEKMTRGKYVDQNGNLTYPDITKTYLHEDILYNSRGMYFKLNNKWYQIQEMFFNPETSITTRVVLEVYPTGDPVIEAKPIVDDFIIDSNYELWNFFGGMNSASLDSTGTLVLSNSSVDNVVHAMNNVGTRLNTKDPKTQRDVFLPLKHSDIHYLATEGAVKQGAANINSNTKYTDNEDYDFQRVKLLQIGILLDKEHHADDGEISLMTLVILACSALGYSYEAATNIYNALKTLSEHGMQEHILAMEKYLNEADLHAILEVLVDSIIKNLATSNSDNFATHVAQDLIKRARAGLEISFNEKMLPLSDGTVYAKMISATTVFLTNTGIKYKIPGLLAVLTPSYNLFKLWDGRKRESFANFDEEIEIIQRNTDPVFTYDPLADPNSMYAGLSQIELGRHYLVRYENGEIEDINIQTPDDYDAIKLGAKEEVTLNSEGLPIELNVNGVKKYIKGKASIGLLREDGSTINYRTGNPMLPGVTPKVIINPDGTVLVIDPKALTNGRVVQVTENKKVGRNLAAYNVRFQGVNGRSYLLWDLDSIRDLFHIQQDLKNETQEYIKDLLVKYNTTVDKLELTVRRLMQRDLLTLSPLKKSIKAQFDSMNLILTLRLNDSKLSIELKELELKKFAAKLNILMGRTDGTLIRLPNGSLVPMTNSLRSMPEWTSFIEFFENSTKVMIDGDYVDINRASLKYHPYERIMPKTFATAFGLNESSDLRTIELDPDYFIKQYARNNMVTVSPDNYQIVLKRGNGKHVYLMSRNALDTSSLDTAKPHRVALLDGVRYRIDDKNNQLYEMREGDEIQVDDLGHEIIVTDDLKFYVDKLSYDSASYSRNVKDLNVINVLSQSSNRTARNSYKTYAENGEDIQSIIALCRRYNSMTETNYLRFPNHPAYIAGREKHSSFLKSLDIIGSRTPSQSMLSFMPERIVAFDNPDVNTSFVSTMQILLLGSDYDVDAVSTETYDIDENGILQLWSPYANYSNIDTLEASMQIERPTGIEIKLPTDRVSERTRNTEIFFLAFAPVLRNRIRIINKGGVEKVEINPDLSTVENILLFNEFLKRLPKLEILSNSLNKETNGLLKTLNITDLFVGNLDSLYLGLYDIANKHNLYFNSINKKKIERIANNYNMYNVYLVAINPANLSLGHLSVDATTGPLKSKGNTSPLNEDLKFRTPGNVVNKYAAIEENMVGKDGIGIAAVGLKSFFTLTNFMNTILNKGTMEAQHALILGKNHSGITIKGKKYTTLANIKALDINSIEDVELLESLASVNQDSDAAIILSAILSLATDNAKELLLAKLNAGTKTLGMYIYGISIGMSFNEIADIMMSPIGRTMVEVARSDVFNYEQGFNNFSHFVFDKFEGAGPWLDLIKFNITRDSDGNRFNSPLNTFLTYFANLIDRLKKADDPNSEDVGSTPLALLLAEYAMNANITLDQKIELINGFTHIASNSYEATKLRELLDYCIDFVKKGHIFGSDRATYEAFKELSKGAAEMKLLGRLLGLNQGIKTSESDVINLISRFERAIVDTIRANGGKPSDKDSVDILQGGNFINLEKFAFNAKYRAEAVERYGNIMHTYNILAVIANSPHYLTYVKALAMSKAELKNSIKFRTILGEAHNLSVKYKIKEDRVTRGLSNYLNDKIIEDWLAQKDNNEIWIPAGNKMFDASGNLTTLNFDTKIKLGTDWGNATFRMWMELEVIPNLKAGKVTPDGRYYSPVGDNIFIRDLTWTVNLRTRGHQSQIVATLPINMLPRQDSEKALFNSYKYAFKNLDGLNYTYTTLKWLSNGRITKTHSPAILDLFTYYAMLANNWKLGEQSLVPLFEDLQDKAMLKDYHDYVKQRDFSGELFDLNQDEARLITYIALNDNPNVSKSPYIYGKDPETHKRVLWERIENEGLQEYDPDFDDLEEGDYDDMTDESPVLSSDQDKYRAVLTDFGSNLPNLNFFPSRKITGVPNQWEFRTTLSINGQSLQVTLTHNNQGRIIDFKSLNLSEKLINALRAYQIDRSPVNQQTQILQLLIDSNSIENEC